MTQHRRDGLWSRAEGPGHVRGEGEGSNVSTERLIGALTFPLAPVAAHDARRELAPPGIVKRNTLLLAASQAVVGGRRQISSTLGAITIQRPLGSVYLAGLATSTLCARRIL